MSRSSSLVLALSIAMVAFPARGQDHCQNMQGELSVSALETRVDALQNKLRTQKASESETDERPEVRKTEEQLLSVSEQLECQRQNSTLAQKGLLTTATFVQVPLLYVTDRQRSPAKRNADLYTSHATTKLEFGRVDAVINEIGGIRTSLIGGTTRVAAPKSLGQSQVQQVQPLSREEFTNLLTAPQSGQTRVRVVLFVHGFNVEFYEAALGLARLATSMQIPLVPVFYSWPSEGKVLGYWHDEDEISAAVVRFEPFLEQLLSTPNTDVVIVCHSMGARIIVRSLGELARRSAKLQSLKYVAFAAGDINIEEFNAEWPFLIKIPDTQWTSYESSGDFALQLSTYIHRFRRLGESDGPLYIAEGMNTIDASSTASILRTFGHSYIINSPSLAADLGDWVGQDQSPTLRSLRRETQGKDVYWKFP